MGLALSLETSMQGHEPAVPMIRTPIGFLIIRLQKYINQRKEEPDYTTTFFGISVGYSKQQKLEAAQALLDNIEYGDPVDKKHLKVLKNGDLGEHYKSYQDIMMREATDSRRAYP
jgi:hypothetical protein